MCLRTFFLQEGSVETLPLDSSAFDCKATFVLSFPAGIKLETSVISRSRYFAFSKSEPIITEATRS